MIGHIYEVWCHKYLLRLKMLRYEQLKYQYIVCINDFMPLRKASETVIARNKINEAQAHSLQYSYMECIAIQLLYCWKLETCYSTFACKCLALKMILYAVLVLDTLRPWQPQVVKSLNANLSRLERYNYIQYFEHQ